METITHLFSLYPDKLSNPDTPNHFGIECEIESIKDTGDINHELWGIKPDGSLRNNGQEFISVPITKEQAIAAFKNLHQTLQVFDRKAQFSPRTSIHVHVNCKNMTKEQVKSTLLYYAMFEEVVFSLVQPSRRDNIHCVALSDTHLPSRYSTDIPALCAAWSKYTAFNLKPLAGYGTIEFRHSDGHGDVERFTEWLTVLDNLATLGKTTPLDSTSLEKGIIERSFDTIFGHCKDYQELKLRLPALIENSRIDIKLSFI